MTATDFFTCQAQLQAEARLALSQAKEMARMQMEVERQKLKTSPITEMVRNSLEKVMNKSTSAETDMCRSFHPS